MKRLLNILLINVLILGPLLPAVAADKKPLYRRKIMLFLKEL